MLSIVHVNSNLPWRGGEQQVLYLTQWLHAQGHRSVVCCPPQSVLYERLHAAGLPCLALPMRHELDLQAAWRLGRYVQQQRADILHLHTPHAHTIGLLASPLARQARLIVARRSDFAPARHWLNRYKYASPRLHYVAVSQAVRQVLVASGVAAQRVETVYSGIDLHRFTKVTTAPPLFPAGTRVIGTVGHLAGQKGHQYLLEAMALLVRDEPHLGMVLVGDGALRPALEAQAAELGIMPHVRFTGFQRDVLPLMQGFDLFVFSSYFEGLGTAILDAMALGKPVVATHAGGIPEAVADGVTGVLVPPRDPQALAAALRQLLHHPEQAQRFGDAGRQRVEQHFTAEQMAHGTLQVYQRILADAPA